MAAAGGTEPLTINWYVAGTNVHVGTGLEVDAPRITVTTSYYATASNACGALATSSTVTAQVPLAPPPSLVATRTAVNQITISWATVAGAAKYVLERRSKDSNGWVQHQTLTTTSFTDTGLADNATYAYRVYVLDANGISQSAPGSVDVATNMTFTDLRRRSGVTEAAFNEILTAVNSVRATLGWPALTWSSILTSNDPVPGPRVRIVPAHLTGPRARFNEALHALGVAAGGYTDPDPQLKVISAQHLIELQRRAQ